MPSSHQHVCEEYLLILFCVFTGPEKADQHAVEADVMSLDYRGGGRTVGITRVCVTFSIP